MRVHSGHLPSLHELKGSGAAGQQEEENASLHGWLVNVSRQVRVVDFRRIKFNKEGKIIEASFKISVVKAIQKSNPPAKIATLKFIWCVRVFSRSWKRSSSSSISRFGERFADNLLWSSKINVSVRLVVKDQIFSSCLNAQLCRHRTDRLLFQWCFCPGTFDQKNDNSNKY